MRIKKGTLVFCICTRKVCDIVNGESYTCEGVRSGFMFDWHRNISEVDFGVNIGIKNLYNDDIFTSRKEALEELKRRLYYRIDRINVELSTMN